MFGLQFFITYIPRLLITQSGMRKIKNREWAMKVLIIGAGGKAVRIAHDLYRLQAMIFAALSRKTRGRRSRPTGIRCWGRWKIFRS